LAEAAPTVAIGSLGAIGSRVAADLLRNPALGRLVAVSARDLPRARARLAAMGGADVQVLPPEALAEAAGIVIECAPAAAFRQIAGPAVAAGRLLIPATVSGLLAHPDLIATARRSGARILVPTGAIAGLDAVRAMARGRIDSATLRTTKAPRSLAGAPWFEGRSYDPDAIRAPERVFAGTTLEAARAFPANVNVAAALALAGIGPERTRVEIWADPAATTNRHAITVVSDAAKLEIAIEVLPSPDNPKSSILAPMSILAALESLATPLRVGS
jgi:aspartate dehydrogenase